MSAIMKEKIVTVPKNGQVCLGKAFAGRTIIIQNLKDGSTLITPGSFVPDNQKTFFTDKAQKQLEEFNSYQAELHQENSLDALKKIVDEE
jgi:hypothetical protein